MSPVAAIAHLAAIAIGVWGGLAIAEAIDLDPAAGSPRESREQRGDRPAQPGENAKRSGDRAAELGAGGGAPGDGFTAACRDAVGDAGGVTPRVRRQLLRSCARQGAEPSPRAICLATVRDSVPPGPSRAFALAACEDLEG